MNRDPTSTVARTGSQLTVGFDGTCLPNRRGFGRFARGILEGLAATNPGHRLEVVVDRRSADGVLVPEGVLLRVVNARQTRSEAAENRGRRSLAEMWSMSRAVHAAHYDVFYFPTSMTFFPQSPWRKTVLTMHDTLAVERPELVFATVAARWLWWAKEQAARWNVSMLTTVSETARDDLSRYYRIPAERIATLAEGVDPTFLQDDDALPPWPRVARKYGIPEHGGFWLTVGSPLPNKNLSRLIEAYAGLPEDIGPLVLVGAVDGECQSHVAELRGEAVARNVEQRVLFAGFVPDDELAVLYRRAQSLIFPSLWEGFGLPAVEAMVSGLPVLYSRAGALPEVIGDAGVMFDPLSVADLRSAWLRVAGQDSCRAELSRRGLERGRRYRWEAAGERLWRVLEKAGGMAAKPPRAEAPSPNSFL
jgi:glycosyltransferase involved in cell wall biosynthesis